MLRLHCRECGEKMQRWGHTRQNKPRFFCPACRKTATPQRNDVEQRHDLNQLKDWLIGKESLTEIASEFHITRQALWKRFHKVMDQAGEEPVMPNLIATQFLIVDGTYIHGRTLCAIIAIDEHDKIYWKFAPYESSVVWYNFLSSFTEPQIIIMDGQKGLFMAAKKLWPKVHVQRCQFHLVSFVMQYLGRNPKEDIGKELVSILYELKNAKTHDTRNAWIHSYFAWEKKYELFLSAKDARGEFHRPRLRSARLIIRRALPFLFTFLDHPGAPNTTNLVEGWVNGRMAEALRLHRGLRLHEKKALATVILSDLKRPKKDADALRSAEERKRYIDKRLRMREKSRAVRFIKRAKKKSAAKPEINNPQLFSLG